MSNSKEQRDISYCSKIGTMHYRNQKYLEFIPHKENNGRHNIDEMKKEYAWIMNVLKGKKVPFISHNKTLKHMDGEEVAFMKNKLTDFCSAFVAITSNGISRFIMHTMLVFYKPNIPILITTNSEEAFEFIKKHTN